jgi:hypothetical protein
MSKQPADELDPSGGLITDIRLPRVLDSGGPLPMDSQTARLAAGELLAEASAIARPRAAWRLALIRRPPRTPDRLEIGGVAFDSPLLLGNLQGLGRVFPFLATEGRELADWAEALPPRRRTAAFIIRYVALKEAERRVESLLAETFGLGSIGAMSPGVLPQWPLTGQRDLFDLLDPLPDALDVSLRPQSLWMTPDMSSSGLYFETGAGFHNCRLCPLDNCPLRRFERSR